jgi:plasmid stabilization system protein ParE
VVAHFEVSFSAKAVEDLDRLFQYIAEHSSAEVADGYLARIEELCLSLRTFPNRGTAVEGALEGLRYVGFEHRATILFRVGETKVEVLRILYGGRNLEAAFDNIDEVI